MREVEGLNRAAGRNTGSTHLGSQPTPAHVSVRIAYREFRGSGHAQKTGGRGMRRRYLAGTIRITLRTLVSALRTVAVNSFISSSRVFRRAVRVARTALGHCCGCCSTRQCFSVIADAERYAPSAMPTGSHSLSPSEMPLHFDVTTLSRLPFAQRLVTCR